MVLFVYAESYLPYLRNNHSSMVEILDRRVGCYDIRVESFDFIAQTFNDKTI